MSQPSLAGKKILVVYGGWEGHKPEFFAEKIVSWLECQPKFPGADDATITFTYGLSPTT